MKQRGIHKVRDERGATALEYALLIAFMALSIVVSVGLLRTALDTAFQRQKDEVATWASHP